MQFAGIRLNLRALPALAALAVLPVAGLAAGRLGYHEVRTDPSGKIIPWFGKNPAQAYDHVVRQVWNFWITMRACPDGVPYYLQHQVWKPDKDDPRGLGGDQINMALSSWNLLYGYLGDPAVHANMRLIADQWMAHGLAPEGEPWGGLPYPYNLDPQSGTYDGDMRAGRGYLQPDKAASFGAELVMMYKVFGDRRYLERAIRIAFSGRLSRDGAWSRPVSWRISRLARSSRSCSRSRRNGSVCRIMRARVSDCTRSTAASAVRPVITASSSRCTQPRS